jgi:hypothetical protein
MKYVTYLVIALLISSSCSKHGAAGFNTKEELVSHYVASVNNKDMAMLKNAYHPRLLKMITKDNADFFKDCFEEQLSRSIPSDRKTSYHTIGDSNNASLSGLPFSDALDYQVAPTLSCQIDFNKSEYSSVTIVLFLSDTKDGWFLILPVPKQDTLVKYRQAKIDEEKQAQYITKTIDTMDSAVYAKIVEQLKQKSLMRAIVVFKETYGDDTTNAALVVKETRRRENLEW